MTVKRPRRTIQESCNRTRGIPMSDIDLSTQFDKISDKAKIASDELKAANNKTKERLQSDVADARDRASAAADRLNDKAVDTKDNASSQWHEMRATWQAHVAKVKAHVNDRQDRLDAHLSPRTTPS